MAKHAADNGGFFGLFKKKKEGYYDFTDTARTKKKNDDYNDSIYSDLKKDYTVVDHSDIEDNGADIAYNNTTSLNNLVSNMDNSVKANNSAEKESTQAVNTIEEVSANTKFDGKLYQSDADYGNKGASHTNDIDNYSNSNEENNYGEDSTFVNGYEYDYQDYDDDGLKKKIIIIAVILVVLALVAYLVFFKGKNSTEEIPVEEETTEVVQEKMVPSISGFTVGKIDNGASLSTNGNFCIAGHNRDGVFKNLNNLVEGTEIKITDPNLNEIVYIVKELREVPPDNLEVLLQDMTKEVITLITCKEGATERLIVIAERK